MGVTHKVRALRWQTRCDVLSVHVTRQRRRRKLNDAITTCALYTRLEFTRNFADAVNGKNIAVWIRLVASPTTAKCSKTQKSFFKRAQHANNYKMLSYLLRKLG